jgi:hypothetical protein
MTLGEKDAGRQPDVFPTFSCDSVTGIDTTGQWDQEMLLNK